ncbi:MAG: hypothetical protein NXI27_09780 [Alphaproteobacteria bacterium]|nr:hypothetical protein [Alphaproteobacteria bacterium]
MLRLAGLCLFVFLLPCSAAMAAVCYGDDRNAEVFIHVEICPQASGPDCTIICVTPEAYEMERGAQTLARFITAVSDGDVSFEEALEEARKKFGTGRFYEIGNVTVEPQLCRNKQNTAEIVCDF